MTDNPAKTRTEMSNAMLELSENLAPVIDMADGMKADLERRGWSPTAAEHAALTWLMGALDYIWKANQ